MDGITDEKSSSIIHSRSPLVPTASMQPNQPNVDDKTYVKLPLAETERMLKNRQNNTELNSIVKPPLQKSHITVLDTNEFTGCRSVSFIIDLVSWKLLWAQSFFFNLTEFAGNGWQGKCWKVLMQMQKYYRSIWAYVLAVQLSFFYIHILDV